MEPVIIVIILGLIFGIGLLFFVRIGNSETARQAALVDEREAVALLKKVSSLPELSCPRTETVETFCIDSYKARAFAEAMEDPRSRAFYFPIFGSAEITLEWLDLSSGITIPLTLYGGVPSDADVAVSTTYFTVYNPALDERMFAVMTVARERA